MGYPLPLIKTPRMGTGTSFIYDGWIKRLDCELWLTINVRDLNMLQLWVALAIMIAESIISLLPITFSYISTALRQYRQRNYRSGIFASEARSLSRQISGEEDYFNPPDKDEEPEFEPPERLVPSSWVSWGLGVSGVMGVVLVWVVFGSDGIHPWATAIGLLLACILSLIGVRALGETDLNPVSSLR